jgi:hypothetical protein
MNGIRDVGLWTMTAWLAISAVITLLAAISLWSSQL